MYEMSQHPNWNDLNRSVVDNSTIREKGYLRKAASTIIK